MQNVRNMDDVQRDSWLVHLPPVLLLAGVGAWLELNLDKLPARYPLHYTLSGQPNAWVPRHPTSVLMPLMVGFVLVVFFVLIQRQLPAGMRREFARAPREDVLLAGRRARRILLGSEYFVAIVFSAVALAPVLGPRPVLWIVVPGVLLLLLTSLALMIPASRKLTGSLRGGASTHYKAGLFYVNPDDPALWVPKRMGVGYTLNFAHAKAWWILGLLLLVPIALAVLLGLLTAR